MYSLEELRRGLRRGIEHPKFFARECNRLYHRRLYRRSYNPDGVDVVAADWDNLLVLDACRYDVFERVNTLPGRLERRQSRGSHTREFLEGNFGGRRLQDVVYVTASPQLHRWRDRIDVQFHAVVDVWREEGWDETHDTVLPETTTEFAIEADREHPNKRLVVHYLQPHYPFIGADESLNPRGFGEREEAPDIWGLLWRGETDVSPERVRLAYRRNLRRALPAVEEAMDGLVGRTVVTADHGNMFGERARPLPVREWGHPPGIHTRQLVEVPWLVHGDGRRKEIVAEAADASAATDERIDDVAVERLERLGYVD